MIITGILDKRLPERLLRESDITLQNTITVRPVKSLRNMLKSYSIRQHQQVLPKLALKKSEHPNLMQKRAKKSSLSSASSIVML